MTNNTRIKIYLPLFLLVFALIFSLILALVWGDGDGLSLWLDLLPGTLLKAVVVMLIVEGLLFFFLHGEAGPADPGTGSDKAPEKAKAE
ncbi:hypothetical protein [Emcibacter nanhaiensis]|uniref:Uncharacterized protein n=1 Tax=Emcibacter nanhaiensis TaxID=1505037 RepID=A0A501PIQ1_9PROT|nr:hypothetical protein [Emcibacter nanhaiensis]TPD59814.1 hypothetical protein FIV46_10000 [Emcibacter nanhaiensis]